MAFKSLPLTVSYAKVVNPIYFGMLLFGMQFTIITLLKNF